MAFVFYDVETTGTDHAFDQILQFAAILTDENLRELDRHEARCRLLPHVVPSPGALAVTRVPISRALDPSLPTHYAMMCDVARRLRAWSPATFLGWNTIGFDEHLLRQAFYQCLHPPYLTNTGGNGRTDLLKLCRALGVLRPGVLRVPVGEDGRPSYRLDRLAPENGFDHSNAHDALADVEATIHVARIVRQRAPDHWSDAVAFSRKSAAAAFVGREPVFVLTESYFGRPFQFALAALDDEPGSSCVLCYDLDVDPGELRALDEEGFAARLRRSPRPIRRVALNAAPMMSRIASFPDFHGVTPEGLLERARAVRSDRRLVGRLRAAAARTERDGPAWLEQRIHDGFPSTTDAGRMRAFHRADWPRRAAIAEEFEDDRLVELGRRLVFHHEPERLSPPIRSAVGAELSRRMTGAGHVDPPWLTLEAADEEAIRMLAECDGEAAGILVGLRAHYAAELARCAG